MPAPGATPATFPVKGRSNTAVTKTMEPPDAATAMATTARREGVILTVLHLPAQAIPAEDPAVAVEAEAEVAAAEDVAVTNLHLLKISKHEKISFYSSYGGYNARPCPKH